MILVKIQYQCFFAKREIFYSEHNSSDITYLKNRTQNDFPCSECLPYSSRKGKSHMLQFSLPLSIYPTIHLIRVSVLITQYISYFMLIVKMKLALIHHILKARTIHRARALIPPALHFFRSSNSPASFPPWGLPFVLFTLLKKCLSHLSSFHLLLSFLKESLFCTGAQLINNVCQFQVYSKETQLYIYIQILSPFRLLQNIEQRSLCYTVGFSTCIFLTGLLAFLFLQNLPSCPVVVLVHMI